MHDQRLAELLARRWRSSVGPDETFDAQRGFEDDLAVARFALVAQDASVRHEFEVAAETAGADRNQRLDLVTDACDLALGAWLEDGRPRLPGIPEKREFEGVSLRFLARVRRPGLEAEADRLLGESEPE